MRASEKFQSLHVVLVHGTWGGGFFQKKPLAPWCNPDSAFVTSLVAECNTQLPNVATGVSAFSWSGSNSVFERAKAAADLKASIEAYSSPDTVVLVLAHSHGGNVAMRATSKLQDPSNVFVATLATPFLKLFDTGRSYKASLPILFLFALLGVGWIDSWAWSHLRDMWRLTQSDVSELGQLRDLEEVKSRMRDHLHTLDMYLRVVDWERKWFYISFLVIPLIAWYLGKQLHLLLINPHPHKKPTDWQSKPQRLVEATMWDARALDNRLLILRGVDDKAALSLAAGAIANRLLRFVYEFMFSGAMTGVLLLICGSAFLDWLNGSGTAGSGYPFPYLPLLFVGVGCLLLPSLFRPVFGRELSFGAIRCDASFESAPDADRAKVVTLHHEFGSRDLIHSIHQHPEVPVVIVRWMAELDVRCGSW
jgi:hypothetical protein